MCGGGSSPAPPEKLAEAPRFAAPPGQTAASNIRRMISRARGATRGGTLLTGPRGTDGPALQNPAANIPLAATQSLATTKTNEQIAAEKRAKAKKNNNQRYIPEPGGD